MVRGWTVSTESLIGEGKGEAKPSAPHRRYAAVHDIESQRLMKQLRETIQNVSQPDFSPERKARKRHPAGKMSRNLSRLMESVSDDAS